MRKRRKGSFGAEAAGDARDEPLFGRNRGKSASRPAALKLPNTQGPIRSMAIQPGPLGLSFRNNESFWGNADRIQVLVSMHRVSLTGTFAYLANGSVLPTNCALDWINTYFWPEYYPMLWHMAQRRDGYRATAAPPLTTNTLPRETIELAITASINARVIAAVYAAALVNAGMRTTIEAFDDINPDRISRAVERTNQFMYPSCFKTFIEYWSQIYSAHPDGPITVNLFDFQAIEDDLAPAVGAYTAWAGAVPNLNDPADINALLDDIDLACTQLLNPYNMGAGDLADAINYFSQLDMIGSVMPSPASPLLVVDPNRWIWDYKMGGYLWRDTKGLGADVTVYWPDMEGSEDTLININPCGLTISGDDDLFWIGGKGVYAYEADDDANKGYTAEAADLTALGLVHPVMPNATIHDLIKAVDIYTREDGWAIIHHEQDFTDVGGVQAFLWRYPWFTCHPDSWRVINSEEAEEEYALSLEVPGFQVPVGIFGRKYRDWLIANSGLPFTV